MWSCADLVLLSFFTALTVAITAIWVWKKKLMLRINTAESCSGENEGGKYLSLNTLQDMKDAFRQENYASQRLSLHGKIPLGEEIQESKDNSLKNYLQDITSERSFLSEALVNSTNAMVKQSLSTSQASKEFSELLYNCILDFTIQIAFGANIKPKATFNDLLKNTMELWSDCELAASNCELDDKAKFTEMKDSLLSQMKDVITDYESSFNSKDGGYINYCFRKKQGTKEMDHDTISINVLCFFLCCIDSLYKTSMAALAFMADSTDVLEKMQKELKEVAEEDDNLVALWLQHRGKVPYSESVLKEVLRLSTQVTTIMGKTNKDVDGKRITFEACLSSVLQDPSVWTESSSFTPRRFLDEDGKVIHHESFIPFGLGYSCCPAQDFATLSCFVILATIIRQII